MRGAFLLERPAHAVVETELAVISRVQVMYERVLERVRVPQIAIDLKMFQKIPEDILAQKQAKPGRQIESGEEEESGFGPKSRGPRGEKNDGQSAGEQDGNGRQRENERQKA